MRLRLLAFLAALAAMGLNLCMREDAALLPRAILALGGSLAALGCVAGLAAYLVRDTLFVRNPRALETLPTVSDGLREDTGVIARISGRLRASRFSQRFNGIAGGILLENGLLVVVVPNQAIHVMGGISSEACHAWWRRELDGSVRRVEYGTLYQGKRRLPALRITFHAVDRLVVAPVEAGDMAIILRTARRVGLPLLG